MSQCWSYEETWNGPGIGEVVVDSGFEIGLIRVPKCASSTATQVLGLTDTVLIDALHHVPRHMIAAVRNPQARFRSALPESLFRLTLRGSDYAGDIEVDDQIYDAFLRLSAQSHRDYVESIMAEIAARRYPDLHVVPMTHFLFLPSGQPRIGCEIYLVENSDEALQRVAENLGRTIRADSMSHRNQRAVTPRAHHLSISRNPRRWVSMLRARVNPIHLRRYPVGHPVLQLSGLQSPITSFDLGEVIRRFAESLHNDKSLQAEMTRFVQTRYLPDIELYNRVKEIAGRGDRLVRIEDVVD